MKDSTAIERRPVVQVSSISLLIFLIIGFIAGALVMALAGADKTGSLKSDLENAGTNIEVLQGKLSQLEGELARLNRQANSNQLAIESNGGRITEVARNLSAIAESSTRAKEGPQPAGGIIAKDDSAGTPASGSPAMETLKEEVKKELKEERKKEEEERRQKMAGQMKEMETKRWRKKLDEEFPKLAEEINLNTTQEFAIKEIAENAFKKIMALWEEAMKQPEDEVDWASFQEKMEKIYKEAESQVVEMVTEKQAEALGKFFER